MKVMTFNIQHCLDYLNNEIDVPFFGECVKKFGADFCGLNEVRGNGPLPDYTDQTNCIGDVLGFERFFGRTIRVAGVAPYGNAFVTRYPVISAERFMIPDVEDKSEQGKYERRGIIGAVIDVDGNEVCFMVCHMGLTAAEQKCAVATLCDMIDTVEIPLILMGDFNTSPDSGILDPLFERLSDTDSLSENPRAYTYPSYDPEVKIDYILYRGLQCKGARTICEIMSDHYPIIAEFDI